MFFNIAELPIRGRFGYFVVQKLIGRLMVEFGRVYRLGEITLPRQFGQSIYYGG